MSWSKMSHLLFQRSEISWTVWLSCTRRKTSSADGNVWLRTIYRSPLPPQGHHETRCLMDFCNYVHRTHRAIVREGPFRISFISCIIFIPCTLLASWSVWRRLFSSQNHSSKQYVNTRSIHTLALLHITAFRETHMYDLGRDPQWQS